MSDKELQSNPGDNELSVPPPGEPALVGRSVPGSSGLCGRTQPAISDCPVKSC